MTEIKLDFDTPLRSPSCTRMARTLRRLDFTPVACRISDSIHGGTHVLFIIKETICAFAIICVQLLLGSDPRREYYNFRRVRQLSKVSTYWRKRWNVLYAANNETKATSPSK